MIVLSSGTGGLTSSRLISGAWAIGVSSVHSGNCSHSSRSSSVSHQLNTVVDVQEVATFRNNREILRIEGDVEVDDQMDEGLIGGVTSVIAEFTRISVRVFHHTTFMRRVNGIRMDA
ncbi:hypothetical protein F4803DRAFT_546355 [Xylaria telfairii]|nr:hypothetical protein F4803DRAFT_546355 [Xylaria telfairii]